MGTLTIRNLPDDLIERLKAVAADHRHSMEQEVRTLLEHRYAPRPEVLRRIRARWSHLPAVTPEEIEHWRDQGRP